MNGPVRAAPAGRHRHAFGTAALAPVLLLAGLLAGAGPAPPAQAVDQLLVRVGIVVDRPSIRISCTGPVAASDSGPGGAMTLAGTEWTVLPAPGGLDIGGTGLGPIVRLVPQSGFLKVDGRAYRGTIELRHTAGGLVTAVNVLDLESYLYGVIKGEIDPRWPPEAVKAQAVAARTLAVERLSDPPPAATAAGYDLAATTDAQVYLGAGGEDRAGNAAVDATRAVLVTYEGRPIFAAYHSNSGGHTEDSENVWGSVYPYLRGVPDPFALGAPGWTWSAAVPLATMEAALRRGGVDVAALDQIELGRTTPWGRAITVRLVGADGRLQEFNANRFRLLVGAGLIRSTMFTTARRGADLEFSGRGSGHGVGLDQWGARAMAARGFTYEQILKYYYAGVAVEQRY
jgi:stage II sporulation protein D